MDENATDSKSVIERAEEILRERDEKHLAEYMQKLQTLDEEYGFELYVPAQPMPMIKVRRKVNA